MIAEATAKPQTPNKKDAQNPDGPDAMQIRQWWNCKITKKDIERVYDAVVESAADGNVQAQKIFLQYSLGKPDAPLGFMPSPTGKSNPNSHSNAQIDRFLREPFDEMLGEPSPREREAKRKRDEIRKGILKRKAKHAAKSPIETAKNRPLDAS